jgi:ribosomal-protein-alanine N-acetyltransferase
MALEFERMSAGDAPHVAAIEGPTRLTEEQLAAELGRPWARLWVARGAEHGVVGFVVAWHVADEIHLLNVATRADRRRRGVARGLLGALVAYAREVKARHVLLEVRRSNGPAIALYRALGFFAMGVRARYYPDDEDAIEMVLAFDVATGAIVLRPDEVRLHG